MRISFLGPDLAWIACVEHCADEQPRGTTESLGGAAP